jgi:hypothetical protein
MTLDIDDEFEDYMRKLQPQVQPHDAQYKESRRVFYAGAAVIYYHLVNKLPELNDEDEVAQELQCLGDQLKDFYTRVRDLKD